MPGSTCGACAGVRARAFGRLGPGVTYPRPNQALDDGKQDTQRVIEDIGRLFLMNTLKFIL
jgi:hypothetical protein